LEHKKILDIHHNCLSWYSLFVWQQYSISNHSGARGTDLPPPFFLTFCLQIYFQSNFFISFLQAIVVYVKYLFMFQNDHKRLGHCVICSIDYWLLYVNRKFKWYELSGSEEKDSSVITAHQSTKRLTLALGILKLRRITWPFL
jgi:hypothetical protein